MNFCHLERKPGTRSLAGETLSWVLKLWYLEEAHIPPTIPKNHKVWAFSQKMAAQKASQTLISTTTTPILQFFLYLGKVKKGGGEFSAPPSLSRGKGVIFYFHWDYSGIFFPDIVSTGCPVKHVPLLFYEFFRLPRGVEITYFSTALSM